MKNFTRIFLAVLLGLLINHQIIAQSAPFKQEMIIPSADGVTLPEKVKITFSAKDPDQGKKGEFIFFDGSPTKEQVHNTLFFGDYPKREGRFFLTPQYKYKLPFTLSYQWEYPLVGGWGYPVQDKYFDEITVSTGDINNEKDSTSLPIKDQPRFDTDSPGRIFSVSHDFDRALVENNPETGHTRLLIYRFYKTINSERKCLFTLVMPVAITGSSYEKVGHAEYGPFDLITILRSAPGDASGVALEKTDVITRKVNWSASQGAEGSSTSKIKVDIGVSKGPVKSGVSVEEEKTRVYKNETTEGGEDIVSYTVGESHTYSGKSTMFLARQLSVDFFAEYQIGAFEENITGYPYLFLRENNRLLMYPTAEKQKEIKRYKDQLLGPADDNTSIAGLKAGNLHSEANFWENAIALDEDIVNESNAQPEDIGKHSVPGGNESKSFYSYSTSKSESRSISQEISVEYSKTVTIESNSGIKIGPLSGGIGATTSGKLTLSSGISTGNTYSEESTEAISWWFQDDSKGDMFEFYTHDDPVFGTPIFKFAEGSKTSDPYEGGLRRDKPIIKVKDPLGDTLARTAKYSDLDLGQEVTFELELKNMSESSEDRTYRLKVNQSHNKYQANVAYGNHPDGLLYEGIPAGNTISLDISLKGSDKDTLGYPDIKVILEAENDPSSSDTVYLSLYYGDTDENRAPDNNNVQNAVLIPVDGSVQSQYRNKYGNLVPITNKNTRSSTDEQPLLPETDCYYGWCAEKDGLPEITNPAWFKFVVEVPSIEINLCNGIDNGFNSQIAVYKATDIESFNTFSLVGANDNSNYCTNPNSARVYLENLTLGDTLYALVDGFQGEQSDFSISAKATPPSNDDMCKYQSTVIDGSTNHYYNFASSVVENEQLLIPDSTDPVTGWKEDSIQHSVWFHFTAPDEGELNIEVTNATFDSRISVYNFDARVCEPYAYNQFVNIAANDDPTAVGGGLDCSLQLRGLNPNGNYIFVVDGYKGSVGTFDLTLSVPVPENDEPCAAIMLENNSYSQGPFSNAGATSSEAEQVLAPDYVETGENGWTDEKVNEFARQIEHSSWFKFVAPPSGKVEISTWNQTNFIAQMAVYEVGNCDDLSTYTLIASEDNSHVRQVPPDDEYPNGHGVRGSILNLTDLLTDSVYYLMIDGSMNDNGAFSIDILSEPAEPPSNDETCSAIELSVDGSLQKGFRNYGATASEEEASLVPAGIWEDGSMISSVWFIFTAPTSGEVEISTCDLANFDTQLAVYSVSNCADLETFTLVAANEDGPSSCSTNGDSYLPIPDLNAGETYYLVVDGYGNNQGSFSIVISDEITPGPANDDVVSAIMLPVNGEAQTGYTNSMATATEQEQSIRPSGTGGDDCITGWCDGQVDNSVWFKFVAPSNGIVYISTCDLADFDTQLALYEVSDVSDFSTFTLIAANDAGPEDCATFFDSYLPVEGLTGGKTYYVMVDGFEGDDGSFDIVLSTEDEIATKIDLSAPDQFKVYPNPFEGTVNLDYSDSEQLVEFIEVKDFSGRTILYMPDLAHQSNSYVQIDLSTAPSGLLVLRIHTKNGDIIKKMIKY